MDKVYTKVYTKLIVALCVLLTLVLSKLYKSFELYAIYSVDNKFVSQIDSYLKNDDDTLVLKEIVNINNSVVTVKMYDVQLEEFFFVELFFDSESMNIKDSVSSDKYLTGAVYMSVLNYKLLVKNVEKYFENKSSELRLVGFTRLLVGGQATAVVYDKRRNISQIYEVSFKNDTTMSIDDVIFLNIEFNEQDAPENKKYSYSIDDFFRLIRNVECHFGKDYVHGTIRLTNSIITVIVREGNSFVSNVHDVHYEKTTMNITKVVPSDLAYALKNNTHDMHRLIKKSPLFS